jgi:hypothetical protein
MIPGAMRPKRNENICVFPSRDNAVMREFQSHKPAHAHAQTQSQA